MLIKDRYTYIYNGKKILLFQPVGPKCFHTITSGMCSALFLLSANVFAVCSLCYISLFGQVDFSFFWRKHLCADTFCTLSESEFIGLAKAQNDFSYNWCSSLLIKYNILQI